MEKVAVLLSGGIDSTTTVKILKKDFDVIAITAIMSDCKKENLLKEAKEAAKTLNVEHKIIDIKDIFKKEILSYFAKSYLIGETPCPCAICNRKIKFGVLLNEALKLGADKIATGHYAKIVKENDEYFIYKAKDKKKDQSYFLSLLPKEILSKVIFPLGEYIKEDIKKNLGKDRKESQDLCFASSSKDYEDIIKNFGDTSNKKGVIKNEEGKILGTHNGIFNYTIGKRRGLGISAPYPLYVKEINPENNDIIVSGKDALFKDTLEISDFNFHDLNLKEGDKVICKIRYNQTGTEAIIKRIDGKNLKLLFSNPVFSITKGQLATIYNKNEKVLGGGIIK